MDCSVEFDQLSQADVETLPVLIRNRKLVCSRKGEGKEVGGMVINWLSGREYKMIS